MELLFSPLFARDMAWVWIPALENKPKIGILLAKLSEEKQDFCYCYVKSLMAQEIQHVFLG